MKFAIVLLSTLLASAYTSMLPYPYYGWHFLSYYPNVAYRAGIDGSLPALPESAPVQPQENVPNARLFLNLVNSLLTTTTTTTTTITSTCTVSTGTNCSSGKKRSILWREEDEVHQADGEKETISKSEVERKERESSSPIGKLPVLVQPSVGHLPHFPSPSLFYNPHVQGPAAVMADPENPNARLFFFAFTSTVTVSTTTTSRSTPTCSSGSSFPQC